MIPGLDENLLSICQMILHGFLLFCDLMVEIRGGILNPTR